MNEFSKACNTENYTGETSQENVIEWIRGDKEVTVTLANNTKYKTRVLKLAEEHPEEVKIRHTNKDGSIVAHLPLKCINIKWPKQLTEAQLAQCRENLRKVNEQDLP